MTGDKTVQCFEPSTLTELPAKPARFHFVGIGGISMSGLARILHAWGYGVSGSDRQESAITSALEHNGVEVQIGHEASALAGRADVLVVTPRAIPGAPNEIRAAVENGAEIVRRGQLLGMLGNAKIGIAAAGSHGKSTTSGMLTAALMELDAEPSYSMGAILAATGRTADSGAGPHMVVEADEFDRAFLWLRPHAGIITTVSFDHPDCFADQADYDQAFVDFGLQIRSGGILAVSADDPGCRRVAATLREHPGFAARLVTFGEHADADWRLRRRGSGWEIVPPDGAGHAISMKMPGAHNVANAAAAIIVLTSFGFPIESAIRGVEAFSGIGRRFEHKGAVTGVDVYDDYAHHSDELQAVLVSTREHFPGRRVVAVFQPHTYSRTAALLEGFARSMDMADVPVLLDVYPAGEVNTWGVTSASIVNIMQRDAPVLATPDDAVAWLAENVRDGDVVLTFGAGDVTVVGDRLVTVLQDRQQPERPPSKRAAGTRRDVESMPLPGTSARILRNVDMSLRTTMRVGGSADFLVQAALPEEVEAAAAWADDQGLPVTVIGGGSNLLVSDDGIRGLVIAVRTPGQRAESLVDVVDEGDSVVLRVGAQAPISWLGRFCAERGWVGMDWAVGLPGQVGGATVNNAGAHGTEIKDHLESIEVVEGGVLRRYDRAWLEPAFRMTRIKGAGRPRPWIVTRTTFRLPRGDRATLLARADDHAAFRKRTQPTGACSGSVFVNPEGDYSGRLLEEAGLKGVGVGAVQFSTKHANWIINAGGGTARETWALIQQARSIILDRYGIALRPEIERVGAWGDLQSSVKD